MNPINLQTSFSDRLNNRCQGPLAFLLLLLTAGLMPPASANEDTIDYRLTKSIGHYVSDTTQTQVKDIHTIEPQFERKLLTQEQLSLSQKASEANPAPAKPLSTTLHSKHVHAFEIYSASVDLINDFDGDGYYHHLRVRFDADVTVGQADVYAKLYLSYYGGPWNLYFTTNVFHIDYNSRFDEYEVETSLAEGYLPGSYDVRIELYEANYDDYGYVAQYGPERDYLLASLALEDEYHDSYVSYNEPVHFTTSARVSAHGGCTLNRTDVVDPSLWVLLLIAAAKPLKNWVRSNDPNHKPIS